MSGLLVHVPTQPLYSRGWRLCVMFITRGIPRPVTHCRKLPSGRTDYLCFFPRALLDRKLPLTFRDHIFRITADASLGSSPSASPTSSFLQNQLILCIR